MIISPKQFGSLISVEEISMKANSIFYDETRENIAVVYKELQPLHIELLQDMQGDVKTNFEKGINQTESLVEGVCKSLEQLALEYMTYIDDMLDMDFNANEKAEG